MRLERQLVRRQIAEQAQDYFGRSVSIDERLYQALELTDDPGRMWAPSSARVLELLLRASPTLSGALSRLGVDLGAIATAPVYEYNDYVNDVRYIDQFTVWFQHPSDNEFCNEYLAVAQGERPLAVDSVVRACLQTRFLDDFAVRVGDPFDDVNDLLGELASAAGHDRDRFETPAEYAARMSGVADELLDGVSTVPVVDESYGEQQFLLYHDGSAIRLRPFGAFGLNQLGEAPLRDGGLFVVRGNTIQPSTRFTEDSLAELELLINSDAGETEFQQFFEEHDEYLLALGGYSRAHAQLILTEDDGLTLVPDFFLEKIDSRQADICDLKRANVELLRHQRNRVRFRDAVDEAVAQLTHYRDYFDDKAHREAFGAAYGLTSYKPRVVIVIGRRQGLEHDVDRLKADSNLPNFVDLRTYDDVVERARQWRAFAGG